MFTANVMGDQPVEGEQVLGFFYWSTAARYSIIGMASLPSLLSSA